MATFIVKMADSETLTALKQIKNNSQQPGQMCFSKSFIDVNTVINIQAQVQKGSSNS